MTGLLKYWAGWAGAAGAAMLTVATLAARVNTRVAMNLFMFFPKPSKGWFVVTGFLVLQPSYKTKLSLD